ncbi:MAG: hypothetical protein ACTSRU_20350, partial [Candidatus Hodarchaeales archaeon]
SIEIYNDDGVLLEEIVLGAETFEARDDSWCSNHGWIHTARAGDIIPCTSCNDMICEGCRCGGCGNCENSDCCECKNAETFEAEIDDGMVEYMKTAVNNAKGSLEGLENEFDSMTAPRLQTKARKYTKGIKGNLEFLDESLENSFYAETFEANGSGYFMETGGRMVTIDSDIEVNYNWQTDPYEIEDDYGEIQEKVEEKVRDEYYQDDSGSGYMREEYLDEDNQYQDYEISYEWTKEVSDGAEEEIKSWAETDLSMNAETFDAKAKWAGFCPFCKKWRTKTLKEKAESGFAQTPFVA